MNLFIDSHAHMNDSAFDADRDEVIARVFASGVTRFVEIACEEAEWAPALALADKYPGQVSVAAGIHPIEASTQTPQNLARLTQLLADPRVVALGEVGLDYTYFHRSDRDTQHRVFSDMLALTKKFSKPLVLHIRRDEADYAAYDNVFSALKTEWTQPSRGKYPGVLHCFSGRYEDAVKALDLGLLLGINGVFTYKKNDDLRQTVQKVGADKIILETDCPYLPPQGKRGTRNDPANIPLIAAFIADYLDIPLERLAELTTQNTLELYGLR